MVSVMKLNINLPFFKYDTMKRLGVINEKLHTLWTCRFRPLKLTLPEKSGVCVFVCVFVCVCVCVCVFVCVRACVCLIRYTRGVSGVLLCPLVEWFENRGF